MACEFDNLSDCILLTLFRRLDSTSLYTLTKVCTRFQRLVLEKSLWKHIDARRKPNTRKKMEFVLDRVHAATETLLMRGGRAYSRILELRLLENFSRLTILALEDQIIGKNGPILSNFPKTLVELSFKNSLFEFGSNFFRKGFEAMGNLKVLIVDGCTNMNSSIIMSVSKYPSLEIFSCYRCSMENSVACFGVAVSHGFGKIKVVDVRLSGLGNTFLTAMVKKPHILRLYFQNRDDSYESDFHDRAEQARRLNLPVPKGYFLRTELSGTEEDLITDFGTLEFSGTVAESENRILPRSILYEYPYTECTCGYRDRQEALMLTEDEGDSINIARLVDDRHLLEFVNDEHFSADENSDEEDNNRGGCSGIGNDAGNFNTETGQPADNESIQNRDTRSSASDNNSHLNAQNQVELVRTRSCTEVHQVCARRETRDQSVGTEELETAPIILDFSHLNTESNNAEAATASTSEPSTSFQVRPESCTANENEGADRPSTSGVSTPLRGRKLSSNDKKGRKRAKRKNSNDSTSSSSDDEEREGTMVNKYFSVAASASDRNNVIVHPADSPFYLSRSNDSNSETDDQDNDQVRLKRNCTEANRSRIPVTIDRPRPHSVHNIPFVSQPGGDVHMYEVRARQPARTQVYPCACGSHSVIVVTADEMIGGDPPLHPPENLFHPRLCEQRINLNDRQSLRVINRAENVYARPEIELVDLKKDQPIKNGLQELSFRGYSRVTDLSLKHLSHLHLELLDVTYTRCTKIGILDFLRVNPNCRVVHKDFCICKPRMDF